MKKNQEAALAHNNRRRTIDNREKEDLKLQIKHDEIQKYLDNIEALKKANVLMDMGFDIDDVRVLCVFANKFKKEITVYQK